MVDSADRVMVDSADRVLVACTESLQSEDEERCLSQGSAEHRTDNP